MRVLQIHNRYRQAGGEDVVVHAEAELLRAQGWEVVQHLADNPTGTLPSLVALAQAPANRGSARAVDEMVRTVEPDVVHIHNTWFQLSPAVAKAAHRHAPVVLTVHNYRLMCANAQLLRNGRPCRLCVDGSLWNGILHSCYHDPASSAAAALTIGWGRRQVWDSQVDLFLALSNFAIELLAEAGLRHERTTLKDNFVPDPGPRTRPAAESSRVLFVGRLSAEKGVREVVRHRAEIKRAGLELKIIGDGPLRDEVAALGGDVLGRLAPDQLRQEMLSARAVLMPSLWYEGQPRTALEAFAAGLPVAGSAHGALGELLLAQGEQWTFDPFGDWQPVLSTLTDDRRVAHGSVTARQLWQERFGPEIAMSALLAAYQRAIETHHGHG